MWTAPKVFGLIDPNERKLLLISLKQLRQQIGVERKTITLDFTETSKLWSDGTLLFLAELKRLIKITNGDVDILCIQPKVDKVAQAFKQLGLFDLLGINVQITPEDDDVVNWRFACGSQVIGEKYEDILQEYDGNITEILQTSLYTGITEAMANVLNHAYKVLKREDGLNAGSIADWWMFSKYQNSCLYVVFCDLGAGIPRTLPATRRSLWNKIMRKGIKNDGEVIRHAVKDSVSRTKKSHRGKGLGQIVRVIDDIDGSEVLILSNSGAYTLKSDGVPVCRNYNDSILGTLILWNIPLEFKEES